MAIRILVVDADPTVQRALGHALSQSGYEVLACGDGAEALRIVKADKPALVLMAANLPGIDGFTIMSRLRMEDGPSTHTPAILLLPENDSEARSKALRAGADDYLVKPFHPAELMARMRSLLARYKPSESFEPPQTTRTARVIPAAAPAVKRREPAKVVLFYGAKGGVGTTTIAINSAIALHKELGRKVCLIDANLQFGDHRVFLDLGLDRMSVVDPAQAQTIDTDYVKQILVKHESGIELLLAPPSPETAELVTSEHLPNIIGLLAHEFDYIIVDIDKRLDSKVKLILNRSNAFTGINVKNAESALKRRIDYQIINEYRAAIGALNSGAPFMYTKSDSLLGKNLLDFVKGMEKDLA